MFRLSILSDGQFWFFRKNSGIGFVSIFYLWFFKKNPSHVVFYKLTKFYCLIAVIFWDIGNMWIVFISFPACDVINFEINLIKPFFLHNQKSQGKFKYVKNKNNFFLDRNHFLSFLGGLQLQKVFSGLRVDH